MVTKAKSTNITSNTIIARSCPLLPMDRPSYEASLRPAASPQPRQLALEDRPDDAASRLCDSPSGGNVSGPRSDELSIVVAQPAMVGGHLEQVRDCRSELFCVPCNESSTPTPEQKRGLNPYMLAKNKFLHNARMHQRNKQLTPDELDDATAEFKRYWANNEKEVQSELYEEWQTAPESSSPPAAIKKYNTS